MTAGGVRKGAGRKHKHPLLKKNPVNYRLPQWLLNWMRSRDEASSVLIENALIKTHKLKVPESEK